MKRYSSYKNGLNSRGLPSGLFETPEPNNYAKSMAEDAAFQQVCACATKQINKEIEEERIPAPFWNFKGGSPGQGKKKGSQSPYTEVKATARQYRKFRNKRGLAYNYGKR
jgi:hypothetical protein